MALHEQKDWLPLVGEFVEIRLHNTPIHTGKVDAVMPDNSILWLSAHGAIGRKMVERDEGYQVGIIYKSESVDNDAENVVVPENGNTTQVAD